MNLNIRAFFFGVVFSCIGVVCEAQVNLLALPDLSTVKVDEIPDSDIKNYFVKASESGITEENMYSILREKDLPESEIARLKERFTKLGINTKDQLQKDKNISNKSQAPEGRNFDKEAFTVPVKKVKTDLSVFGSELFDQSSLVFEPNLRIATPAGYILGPDDELVVNIFGYSERTYNLTVNAEGNIYIPQVGPLFVNGLSIEQASSRIKNKLASTIYRAISSGQTRVQVSLGKIRSIRVTVIGEAKKPGTYTVSSLTTLFNVLYLCGGPTDLGSYRKIELIRGNEVKRVADLYNFLLKGDQKDNVLLQEGDVVRIPYYAARVILDGHIRHKGKYEMIEGETFDKLLQLSGGFTDDAYKGNVTVYQVSDQERKIKDLHKNEFNSYQPQSGDSIHAGKILDRYENLLTIKGAVMRPGEYELTSNLTLKQLIEKAGGVKEDVYTKRGSISRLNTDRTPVQLAFDVDSIMNGLLQIPLRRSDSITIYSIFELTTKNMISVDGLIKKPGTYRWADNITLRDVILMAGGFTEGADMKNIEISRRIENIKLTQLNHVQTEIIMVDLSDTVHFKDVVLNPFDAINIRQQAGYTNQRTVFVDGMVINPGRYTLKMSGDKISDIIIRAGGFTANADTTAIVIKRLARRTQSVEERKRVFSKLLNIDQDSLDSSERIREEINKEYDLISIDLYKALHSPNESENMLLEDGDILIVERNTNLVKVSGEVYFPTIIPFKKGESMKYYIQKSGSYTQVARKRGALVIYPDGKAKKVKHFLFFNSYPEVVSRSEIFVPPKSEKNKSRITLGEWSVVVSSLAIISNVILNLRR
ncbi:MAG TPA: SLBB domain-containing protein [Ferruginibacter sp.]|nr:SLBB domain-containing protein [Ferruginibacter sp.]HMP19700.1 SLBB domain-containing protein [Ferruginibacter sp.]